MSMKILVAIDGSVHSEAAIAPCSVLVARAKRVNDDDDTKASPSVAVCH